MRSSRAFLITACIACLIGFAMPIFADESLAIVTGRSSILQSMSLETLKRVYLRKSLLDSKGVRWIPLNLPISHELRQGFSSSLFKKLPEDQEDYWNEQYFQGINPPEVLASEEAVLRFVVITPGAIGYVRKRNVDDRVKILTIISIPEHR
jgi:folate-dependent tRNA-U54 methylase TrmFO/GidA